MLKESTLKTINKHLSFKKAKETTKKEGLTKEECHSLKCFLGDLLEINMEIIRDYQRKNNEE